jgi:shikimate kinase
MSKPIAVLIGAPGAGKSTIGRRVAERLKVPFVDTDALIEEESGMSVSDMFVELGEPEFRVREEEAVRRALAEQTGGVALGGGAILSESTRQLLADHTVVWLRVNVSDAASRVGMNQARPLLLGNVRGRLTQLLNERTPLYESVASITIETDGRAVREVTSSVLAAVAA